MSEYHDIGSGNVHDTMTMLSAQQREQLRQHRIEESLTAFRVVNRVAEREQWPEEDLAEVLGALNLTGERDNDLGLYGGRALPRAEPGSLPQRR